MNDPEGEQKLSPRSRTRRIFNFLAVLWLFATIFPGSIMGLWYINPIVFKNYPNWQTFNVVLLLYGLMMLLANWFLVRGTNTRTPEGYSPPSFESGHFFCATCNRYQPPRAHHCDLCQTCILKHDHHCFFAATCIGHFNQRYFVVFTSWLMFGCFYSFFVSVGYIKSDEWREDVSPWNFVLPPLAVIRFMFGYLTPFEMFCIFVVHSMIIGTYAAGFLTVAQMFLIRRGLSSFEKKKGLISPIAHLSPSDRMCLTFGRYWFINFLLPIGPLRPLMWDGTRWHSNDQFSEKEHDI